MARRSHFVSPRRAASSIDVLRDGPSQTQLLKLFVLVCVGALALIRVLQAERGHAPVRAPAWQADADARAQHAERSIRRQHANLTGQTTLLSVDVPPSDVSSHSKVHVLTFADKPTIYLDVLAASVSHFNDGEPLHVLGLSRRRTPTITGPRWNITRQAISGSDPGKLKKLWFMGSLLDDEGTLG